MNEPTLSVVMTNYNHSKYLPEALEAVLGQSYQPKEIVIIDDGSTDDSVKILEGYAAQSPLIRLFRNERNMGNIHNVKRLVELATGDYLIGCACDDRVLPGLFEKSMALVTAHPEAAFCSARCWMIREDGGDIGPTPTPVVADHPCYLCPADVRRLLCVYSNWIEANTTVFRRDALIASGGFNPDLHAHADGFVFQVMALRYGACYIPEPLGAWRVMNGFAASCASNLEIQRKIWRVAAGLMRNEHKDLFPGPYVDHWEEWMFRGYARTAHLAQKAERDDLLARLKDLHPSPNFLNQMIHLALRSVHRVDSALTMFYLRSVHIHGEAAAMRRRKLVHWLNRRFRRDGGGGTRGRGGAVSDVAVGLATPPLRDH